MVHLALLHLILSFHHYFFVKKNLQKTIRYPMFKVHVSNEIGKEENNCDIIKYQEYSTRTSSALHGYS